MIAEASGLIDENNPMIEEYNRLVDSLNTEVDAYNKQMWPHWRRTMTKEELLRRRRVRWNYLGS
jgi:hypothetical protein